MSENDKNKQPTGDGKKDETIIKVEVDSEQMKVMLKQLEEEKARAKKLQEDVDKALAEKKVSDEALEKSKTESDDYKSKLELIAQKEFEKKRTAIIEKAKVTIKDEARIKAIEAELTDPEKLKATEFMIDTLNETLKKGEEEAKAAEDARKKAEEDKKKAGSAPAGSIPLTPAQTGQGAGDEDGYDSYMAMIQDLRRKEKNGTPEEQAEAKVILDELFKKWAGTVRKRFEGIRGISHEEENQKSLREITKKGGAA